MIKLRPSAANEIRKDYTMTTHKFLSTGGLGDAWIVWLKIVEFWAACIQDEIDWIHVESHDGIRDALNELFPSMEGLKFQFLCDPLYQQHVREGLWKDRIAISTSIDGKCDLHGETMNLSHPFLLRKPIIETAIEPRFYDVTIQVSGGAKNDRNWKFDLLRYAAFLRSGEWKVALVGNDSRFADDKDPDNFVGKIGLNETLQVIDFSKLFIGLSGFLNYYACSNRVKNIHLIESEENEKRYYHPLWSEYTTGIVYPSFKDVNMTIAKLKIKEPRKKHWWNNK